MNPRYVDMSDTSAWDGTIKRIDVEEDGSVTLWWKLVEGLIPIDMGAYEYQLDSSETFTVQMKDDLDTGSWQEMYKGKFTTWTDTEAAEVKKRFYRVWGE